MSKAELCPNCGAAMQVNPGFVTWCPACNWNIDPDRADGRRSLAGRLNRILGQKSVDALRSQVLAESGMTYKWSWRTFAAYVFSAAVHLLSLYCYSRVVIHLYTMRTIGDLFFGMVFLIISLNLFPPVRKLPKPLLDRSRYPAIYRVLDELAEGLGATRVDHVIAVRDYTAFLTTAGWRRRRIVGIGLPLFAALAPEEKIAILAHEMAHHANRDITRRWFVGSAWRTLAVWHNMVAPNPNNPTLWPRLYWVRVQLAKLVFWPWYLLGLSVWRESQQAEYYADRSAAELVGTEPMRSSLQKFHLGPTFILTVERLARFKFNRNLFDEFRSRIAHVPDIEKLRLDRLLHSETARADTTHPPTAYRLAYLDSRPCPPTLRLSATLIAEMEAEFAELEREMQNGLLDDYKAWYLEAAGR
ncbi:M48 family metallopeptidase [Cohnella sp. GCM10020058]|uniref:M48 family metallopeptidase n=1 Tax=Cohnella sp. GCM10020058 TaxID=3317330 RepID=UPI003645E912